MMSNKNGFYTSNGKGSWIFMFRLRSQGLGDDQTAGLAPCLGMYRVKTMGSFAL